MDQKSAVPFVGDCAKSSFRVLFTRAEKKYVLPGCCCCCSTGVESEHTQDDFHPCSKRPRYKFGGLSGLSFADPLINCNESLMS